MRVAYAHEFAEQIAGEMNLTTVGSAPSRMIRRPPEVWTLVGLNLMTGATCFVATVAPATMHKFVGRGLLFGAIFLGLALVTALSGRLLGHGLMFSVVVADIGLIAGLEVEARTNLGAALAPYAFVWTMIYAAAFFRPGELRVVLVLTAAASLGGLASNGVDHWGAIWILVNVTTVTVAVVVDRFAGRLRREAETDDLTGVANRRGLQQAAALAHGLASRAELKVTLCLIDLDDFKSVNDTAGHAAGDRMLAEAARCWAAALREGDVLARVGGDEFVLLLPATSAPEVDSLLGRLRLAHPIRWTAGVSTWASAESFETCLERADAQLYARKAARRARPGDVAGHDAPH